MGDPKRMAETHKNKKPQPVTPPKVEAKTPQPDQVTPTDALLDPESLESQASLLQSMPPAQQQSVVSQYGRMQGNRYVTNLVSNVHHTSTTPATTSPQNEQSENEVAAEPELLPESTPSPALASSTPPPAGGPPNAGSSDDTSVPAVDTPVTVQLPSLKGPLVVNVDTDKQSTPAGDLPLTSPAASPAVTPEPVPAPTPGDSPAVSSTPLAETAPAPTATTPPASQPTLQPTPDPAAVDSGGSPELTGPQILGPVDNIALSTDSLPAAQQMLSTLSSGGSGFYPNSPAPGSGPPMISTPAFTQWQSGFQQSVAGVTPPDLMSVSQSPNLLTQRGLEITTNKETGDPTLYQQEALANVGDSPKVENPPPPPVADPVPEATQLIKGAVGKRLPSQTLPSLTRSPKGRLPVVGGQNVSDQSSQTAVNSPLADGTSTQLNPGITKVEDQLVNATDVQASTGDAPGVTLEDKGPEPAPDLPADMKTNIQDSLATLLADTNSYAKDIVNSAERTAYPQSTLEQVASDIGDSFVPEEEQALKTELNGIADAAGIAQSDLDTKTQQIRDQVDALSSSTEQNLQTSDSETQTNVEDQSLIEQKNITGASNAVDQEILRKEESSSTQPDPAVIERKRDSLLEKVTQDVSAAKADYRRAGQVRNQELTSASEAQQNAYRNAAKLESDEIKSSSAADQESAGRIESRQSLDWGDSRAKATAEQVRKLKQENDAAVQQYITGLDEAVGSARGMIRAWADEKTGTERGWFESLFARITDWSNQARADNEAWEKQRLENVANNLASDFQALASLRDSLTSENKEEVSAAFNNLTAEQQQLAFMFFQSGGNSVAAVATGLIGGVKSRRVPELHNKLREKAIKDLDWQKLNLIGMSQSSGFDAGIKARDVRGAVKGWGTKEEKLFTALGGRTVEQLAAMRKAYAAIYSRDMDEDIRDDLSGTELERAEAALSGDATAQDVTALHDAMHGGFLGWGTDEDLIMKTLRNKSPEEREKIVAEYKKMYGVDLMDDFESDMSDHDLDRANALLEGDKTTADAIALDQAMNGSWFFGLGTDEDAIEDVYDTNQKELETEAAQKGMTTAELEAAIRDRNSGIEGAYNDKYADGKSTGLRDEFEDEMSGADLDLAVGLADYDTTAIDSAKLQQALTSFSPDKKTVATLRSPYERAKKDVYRDEQVKFTEMAAAQGWDVATRTQKWEERKVEIDKLVQERAEQNMGDVTQSFDSKYSDYWTMPDSNYQSSGYGYSPASGAQNQSALDTAMGLAMWSGNKMQMADDLINQGGKLTDDQEIYYSVKGAGTDEDMLKKILGSKSKEEIEEIKAAYKVRYGEDMQDDVMSDLSGRDSCDIGLVFEYGGEGKGTAEEELARMRRRMEFEFSGMGTFFAGEERMVLMNTYGEANSVYNQYQTALKADPNSDETKRLKALFDRYVGYGSYDVKEHRQAVDKVTDIATTAAAVVVAAAAIIVTAGTAAPGVIAAALGVSAQTAGAIIAATAAGVSSLSGMGIKAAMKGDAYGWEDWGSDLATLPVDVAMSYFMAARWDLATKMLQNPSLSSMARGSNLANRMMAHFLTSGMENTIESLPSALLSTVLTDNIWDSDNPLLSIVQSVASKSAKTFVQSGSVSAILKGIKTPEQTVNTDDPNSSQTETEDLNSNRTETDDPTHVDDPTTHVDDPTTHVDDPTTNTEVPSGKAWDDPTLTKPEFIQDYRHHNPTSRLTDAELEVRFNKGLRVNPETGRLKNPPPSYESSGKSWDDPALTKEEFIGDYRMRNPTSKLTDAELDVRFNEGMRVNPETGRLKKPAMQSETPPSGKASDDPTLTKQEFINDYRNSNPTSKLTDAELALRFRQGSRLNPETGRLKRMARFAGLDEAQLKRLVDLNEAKYQWFMVLDDVTFKKYMSLDEGTFSRLTDKIRGTDADIGNSSGQQYLDLAQQAYDIYSQQMGDAKNTLENIFGEFGSVQGRAKRPESAANRLQRSVENFGAKVETVQDAVDNLWDAIGTRIILKDGSPETMQQVVDRLIAAMQSGQLEVVRANSLAGEGGLPYITKAQLEAISDASGSVKTDSRIYDTGYTTGTIYVKYANGVMGEIQIIGSKTLELANAEHLVYDAFINKPYLNAFDPDVQPQAQALIEPIRSSAQALDLLQQVQYDKYLTQCYRNARVFESGETPDLVKLPEGFPSELSAENLLKVQEKLSELH